MKYLNFKLLILFAALALAIPPAWAETAILPTTQALTTSFANVGSDANIKIKISNANGYTNPWRFYANTTLTIKAEDGYAIQSVIYEASSTGNYVSYAQNATVTPAVTPTVSGKTVTWTLNNVSEFTFKPSSQTRASSITINYTATGGSTLTPVTLSFPEESYTTYLGQAFDAPDLTVNPSGAADEVVYSSSNTNVATVASDGTITLVDEGTTTITASITDSETYQDASAEYTLNVVKPFVPGESATIVFKNNGASQDGTTEFSSSAALIQYIEKGANYVQSASSGKVYSATEGIKFSSSSTNGSLELNLTSFPNVAKVTVKAKRYGSDAASMAVTINDETQTFTPGDSFTDYVYTLNGATVNKIEIDATKRLYVKSITIETLAGDEAYLSVSPESIVINDEGGSFAVVGSNLGNDNVGVTRTNNDFKPQLTATTGSPTNTDANWFFTPDNGSVNGNVGVTYEGYDFSATGQFMVRNNVTQNQTVTVTYKPNLYIVGDYGNGWNFNDGMLMNENDGVYTIELDVENTNTYIAFARKVGEGVNFHTRYVFSPSSNGDWQMDADEKGGTINVRGAQPVHFQYAGHYAIEINTNDGTFTITRTLPQVVTPKITPNGGNFGLSQTVTITSETVGAAIYYTTDETEPSVENGTLYESEITLNSTTTIKAIAVKDGMRPSEVATATFTKTGIDNLAGVIALGGSKNFTFAGEVVVTHVGTYGSSKLIGLRDLSQNNANGTGGGVFFNTPSNVDLKAGEILAPGWSGRTSKYGANWIEITNATNVTTNGTATVMPFDRTGVALTATHQSEYIILNNVTIDTEAKTATWTNGERTVTYSLFNRYDDVTYDDGNYEYMIGLVSAYGQTPQVYPIELKKAQQDPNMSFAEQTVNATFGAEFNEPALTKPEGVTVTYSSSDPAVAEVNETTGEVTIKKVGNATITATSVANQYYTSGTASYNIVVTAGTPTFAYSDATATAVFGQTATLPTLDNPNGLSVTYSSSAPAVATVNDNGEVTIVGAGTTVITATGAATGNYNGATATYTLTVTKAQATLSFAEEVINATYGGEAPANALTNDANLAVTYSIEPEGVATIDPATGKLTIVGVGTATVTATGEANANYEGTTATYTLTVSKAQATLAFEQQAINAIYGGEAPANALTNEAGLTVTYSITPEGVATIDPATGKLSIVGVGTATVTATGEANANYEGATATYTLTVSKAQATLAFEQQAINAIYGGEAPANALTNEAGLTVTYSIAPEGVATIDPATGKLSIVGVGTATVTATGEANANYEGATATYTLTVSKAQATLAFAKGTINATIGGEVEANPLTNEAGLTVTYSIAPEGVATIDPATGKLTIVGTGSAIITATGAENDNYLGTTATYTINVAAADAITFTLNTDVTNYTVGDKVKVKVDNVQNAIGDYTITYKIGDTELVPDENDYVTIPTAEVGTVTLTVTVKDAYEHSTEATQNFVFNIAAADAITFTLTPDGGEYTVGDKVNVKVSNIQNTIGDYTITYTTNFTREPQNYDPEQGIDITSDEAGQVNLTVTVTDAYEHAAEGTKSAVYKFAAAPAIEITLNPDGGEYIVGDVVNVTVAVGKTLGDYTVVYQIDGGEVQNYDAATGIVITRSTVGNVDLKVTVTDGYEHEGDGTASATYVFKPVPVVAAPTFSLASGTYDTPQDVTITGPEGATIYYSVDGGLTWTEGNSLNMTETTILMAKAVKDGIESPVVTNAYVIKQTVERIPVEPIDGYFSIKNNGNNMFANVQGRKTLTFCDDAAKEAQAGTVIYVKTDKYGQVQSLRSQAADLQGYADRAMRYVPEVVQLVVDKLHATGVGSLLGEDGYDAIKDKFNESFDYHLYVEKDGENYRIYGKTPSMQPVVDFYAENMSRVDEKLPMLEDFINDAIDKVLNKTNGHGASILVDYDLEEVWQRMGGNLTKPEDEASTMAFYRQVLCNKDNVWNFAYQSVMIYWERLKNHDLYEQMKEELGEFANYVDKLEQILPDMKYYIVADGNKVDYISAGNGDIINGAARTYWTLVPRTTFTKNFDENNYFGCILNKKYVATLYTDFAYTLPEDVKAYKVTRVSVNGLATLEALSGAIPAQTPVLLMSEEAGDKVLNLSATGTADMAKNLLVGPDYLIDEYKLVTPQVQGLFNFVKQYVSEEFYNTYVTPYEHLMYKNSGTVGNKYFWGLPSSDLDLCVYTNAENSSDCVVRSLGVNEATGTFGFVDHWSVRTNEAFLVSSEVDEIRLSNRGDVNHDGVVDINDVTLTISRVLGIDTPDCCPYCADVVETGVVDIDDVTELINIVLGVR